MIGLVDYLSAYTDNRYKHLKLSDERKEHLLNLDAEYGELVQLFRKRFNAKRVENLDEERERHIEVQRRPTSFRRNQHDKTVLEDKQIQVINIKTDSKNGFRFFFCPKISFLTNDLVSDE